MNNIEQLLYHYRRRFAPGRVLRMELTHLISLSVHWPIPVARVFFCAKHHAVTSQSIHHARHNLTPQGSAATAKDAEEPLRWQRAIYKNERRDSYENLSSLSPKTITTYEAEMRRLNTSLSFLLFFRFHNANRTYLCFGAVLGMLSRRV